MQGARRSTRRRWACRPRALVCWRRRPDSCVDLIPLTGLCQLVFLLVAASFDCLLELLSVEKRPIATARRDQLDVRSLLDDATVVEHDGPCRVPNRAYPMRRD